jgi:integrase
VAKQRKPRKGSGLAGRQLDLVLPGVGTPGDRFVKAWGVDDTLDREARRAVVRDLYNAGQLDVLRSMLKRPAEGGTTWAEVLQAKRRGELTSDTLFSSIVLRRPLWGTEGVVAQTLPKMGGKPSTRRFYREMLDALKHYAGTQLSERATVADLRRIEWTTLWAAMAHVGPGRRNHLRASVSALLTAFLDDKYHPFRRGVMKAMGKKEAVAELARNVTAEEFWTLMDHVPEPLVACYLTLAATGMRVGEYLACTEQSLARFPQIHIPSGKSGEALVQVDPELEPYVRQAIPCMIGPRPKRSAVRVQDDARYRRLQRSLKAASEATGIPATIHTLRHFYAGEGVKAQPEAFVQQAMRHKTAGMTKRYAAQREQTAVAGSVGQALRRKA